MEMLSVGKIKKKRYNCEIKKKGGISKMTTPRLLHERIEQKGYSKIKLQNEVGCCEKTLRQYLNGTTTSGPYLTRILEVLDISVAEWNSCENIKIDEVL